MHSHQINSIVFVERSYHDTELTTAPARVDSVPNRMRSLDLMVSDQVVRIIHFKKLPWVFARISS